MTIPGIPRAEKEEFEKKVAEKKDAKKKKKVPSRVDCAANLACGTSLS